MADSSSKVQEAAVSAMAVLEEEAGGKLIPHVLGILNVYAQALAHYKTKNLIILYDACGTLAEALGEELNKPELIAVLLPPLIAKWDAVPDEDKSLLPLLECMSYIVQALGMGFAQYAQPVMARCERIIAATLTAEQEYADEEFIVCALDLLSGLAGGLGGSMEALMSSNNSQVVPMLMQCLTHMMPDVRQSAFALLGDLAKSAITHLHPVLQPILQAVHANLDPEHLSVCNNACWSVGEITVRSDAAGMSGAVHELVVPLINILCRPRLHKSLLENAAITLGRFAMVCPDVVSQSLPNFIKPWCTVLTSIRDDIEKEHALRGMVKMAYLNPGTLVDSWPHVCEAINSWRVDIRAMSPDLMQEVTEMLRWFKSNLEGAGQWDACHGRTSMAAKHGLQHNFGLA
jgi:transportin-1